MDERIENFRRETGFMEFYANHNYWLNLYTIDESGEKDYHTMEFSCYDDVLRFVRMIQNTQTPVSETDTIFVGAYGPILEVEEK